MKTPKCGCGGRFERRVIAKRDLSAEMGVPCTATDLPVLLCDACGTEALPGEVINVALRTLAVQMIQLPLTLDGPSARFLRKMLPASQKDLAKRMGLARETVVRWEAGKVPLSPQQDLNLRAMTLASLFGMNQPDGGPSWNRVRNEHLAGTLASLGTVKPERSPKARPLRFVLDSLAAA